MSRRLYLGSTFRPSLVSGPSSPQCPGLPTDVRSEDVSKFFDGYGRIVDCRVMTGECAVLPPRVR